MKSLIVITDANTLSKLDWNGNIINPEEIILVIGANGFVGSRVVRTLLWNGFKGIHYIMRATSKSGSIEDFVREFADKRVKIVKSNLLSRDECIWVVERVPIIYYLVVCFGKSFPGLFLELCENHVR